jgi:hypothetical protein
LIKANAVASEQLDRIIEMAWEDRTPFEAIEYQFGLMEKRCNQLDAPIIEAWILPFLA